MEFGDPGGLPRQGNGLRDIFFLAEGNQILHINPDVAHSGIRHPKGINISYSNDNGNTHPTCVNG